MVGNKVYLNDHLVNIVQIALGTSQKELAERLNLSPPRLSQLADGGNHRSSSTLLKFYELCQQNEMLSIPLFRTKSYPIPTEIPFNFYGDLTIPERPSFETVMREISDREYSNFYSEAMKQMFLGPSIGATYQHVISLEKTVDVK